MLISSGFLHYRFSPVARKWARLSRQLACPVGVLIWGVFGTGLMPVQAQPAPVAVEVARVVSQTLVEEVSFVATLEPNVASTVGAVIAGRILTSEVREGDRVVAGKTLLIRLDPTAREIALREMQAAVDKAREKWEELKRGYRAEEIAQRKAEVEEQKAILGRAEGDYLRAERLVGDELIARAEFDRLKSEFLAAQEKHRRLQAALELAESGPRREEIAQAEAEYRGAKARQDQIAYDLDRGTLLAPFTGYVVKKHVDVGTWVNPGDPVVDLVNLDPIYAAGPVGERKIDLLKKGMTATVTLDALPGQKFQGTVSHIVPQADPQSRTFPVKISLLNPHGRLKSGMLARVAIKVMDERKSLLVPKDAVIRQGSDEVLYVIEGDLAKEYKVKTGRAFQGSVEVFHDALQAGQEVVILGNELLSDRAKVRKNSGNSKNRTTRPR